MADTAGARHTLWVPEILEIELYRRALAPVVGRRIRRVHAPDAWFLKHGLSADAVREVAEGRRIEALRRHGKLLLAELSAERAGGERPPGRGAGAAGDRSPSAVEVGGGPVLGLRFGMTGVPILDELGAPFELSYASNRVDPAWDRFVLDFDGGGRLRINDARRLGGVELDPDTGALGPDALTLGLAPLRRALGSAAAVKAVLLDQSRVAGLGNMLADEVLFRAGIDPARPARSLDDGEVRRLHRAVRRALPDLLARGGSHAGRLAVTLRTPGARCPIDGAALVRRTIGGRTSYACPVHQH